EVGGNGGGDRIAAAALVAAELGPHERRALLRKDLGWDDGEAEATGAGARVDAPVDTQGFLAGKRLAVGEEIRVVVVHGDQRQGESRAAPRQEELAERHLGAGRGQPWDERRLLRPFAEGPIAGIDVGAGDRPRATGRRPVGVRGLSMDPGEADIRPRERLDELLVGPIIDVHEAEVVVLAVLPAALRIVVVLEPVGPDDRRLAREALGRGGGAARSL